MPHTIVCSVGTSAAKGICKPDQLADWVEQQGGVERAAATLLAGFAHVPPEGMALQKILSAEIHSLVRIGVSAADRVIFLASDTPDGLVCAHALKGYLERYYAGILVETIRPIKGLQVKNAELFRREGVVNFVRACLQAVHDYGAEQVVLNPTGGYKALVPYTVLVGMLKRVPCRYIFEQSTELLTLPPLPVAFDRSLLERYRSLLERFEPESSIPTVDWDSAVRHDDRPLLESLIERISAEVTPSGVGVIVLDEFRSPTALVPFLSRQAWEDCLDNLARIKECDPFRFLQRVAGDQNQFKIAEHINAGNGLRWLKPGRTTDRYLVSVEDWRMLVWRAIREDEVGADYPTRVKVDLESDRARLGPFTRMEFDRPVDGST